MARMIARNGQAAPSYPSDSIYKNLHTQKRVSIDDYKYISTSWPMKILDSLFSSIVGSKYVPT
jgi:hypothetical protein